MVRTTPRLILRSSSSPAAGRARFAVAAGLAATLVACGGGDPGQPAAAEGDVASEAAPIEAAPADDAALVTDEAAPAADAVADAAAEASDGSWQSLQADWTSSVDSVQAHFGELSAEDLIATGGDREQLVTLVQQTYELAPEEAEQQVSDFEATL